MAEHVQVLIIGAGTAGLSAAIYAARQALSVLVIENKMTGGQIVEEGDADTVYDHPQHPYTQKLLAASLALGEG